MPRLLLLLVLALLPLAPAQAADPPDDMTRIGDYPELTRAIATTRYHLVLKHPVIEERLRELVGPHYDRMIELRNIDPVGYHPLFELVLAGTVADTMQKEEAQRDQAMIVVDWTTGRVWAALRKPEETLVFASRPYLNELPRPLRLFVREKALRRATLDRAETEPPEDWIRILNYGDDPPQLWPKR